MEEKMRFVTEVERGEHTMAELCRHFGISRKTGHLLWNRYLELGFEGLNERSRAPLHSPQRVSDECKQIILDARRAHPSWGPRKLRALLQKLEPTRLWPVHSTIGCILSEAGLIAPRKRRVRATPSTDRTIASNCNDVWCIDFKGWWRTLDGSRCDPLTLTDLASRFLLLSRLLPSSRFEPVQDAMETTFRTYGLPLRIRSDNGSPFASTSFGGLSRLSLWWIELGIEPERIEPGCPEQNGAHERMHGTLQREVAAQPASSWKLQQKKLQEWREEYNEERPHEALGQQPPASVYQASAREYPRRIKEVEYPEGMQVKRVKANGELSWQGKHVFVSEVLAKKPLGFKPISDGYWRVFFSFVPLGWFNERTMKFLRDAPRAKSQAQILKT